MTRERCDPDPVPRCDGCGGVHGSVGAEFHCLRAALRASRATAVELRERIAALTVCHPHQASPRG